MRLVNRLLAAASLFLIVVSARLWLISVFGSAVPILDQWDAEAAALFQPWLEGTLRWTDLFNPHNEHRIVLSRLLALALLKLNGQWDALLEMTANALFCGVIGLGVTAGLLRIMGLEYRFPVLMTVVLWLALPYAHENTLWGFQSAFYFLLAFSLLTIWGLGFFPVWSRNWWLGAIGAILAGISMGSGFFAAAIVLVLEMARLLAKRRRWFEVAPTCLVAIVVVALGLYFRTTFLPHVGLRATSVSAWLNVFARSLAWPYCTIPCFMIVMYLPWATCTFSMIRTDKRELQRHRELLSVVGAWVIVQAAAIGYARGEDGHILISSRYMDILGLGAAVNALCLILLIKDGAWRGKRRAAVCALAAVWIGAAIFGAAQLSLRKLMSGSTKEILLPMEENVRAYVATHDLKQLDGERPYPARDRLAGLLDNPAIRKILPAIIRPALPITAQEETGNAFVVNGYPAALTTPAYERAWGSYSQSEREARGWMKSETFHSAFPYLQFEVAGALRAGTSLSLRDDATGKEVRVNSPARLNENWRSAIVPVPGSEMHIIANDDSATKWFAFREPREWGRFGYYAQLAVANGKYVFIFSVAVFALTILNPLRRSSRFEHHSR
jgi:hypothetical protein